MFYRIYKNLEDIPVTPIGTPKIAGGAKRSHRDDSGLLHLKDGSLQKYLFGSIMSTYEWNRPLEGFLDNKNWIDNIDFEKFKQEILSIPIDDLLDSYFVYENGGLRGYFTRLHIVSSLDSNV